MSPSMLLQIGIIPANTILELDSTEARVMQLAIAFQESSILHRFQIGGPAVGYYQFERNGIIAVLNNPASASRLRRVCDLMDLKPTVDELYRAIPYNEVLASVAARLLLWCDPAPLPTEESEGWAYYLRGWRPGRPHPDRWPRAWALAKGVV